MNFIAIGLAGSFALVIIALLLSKRLGLKPWWASSHTRQKAAEEQRKNQILKG